MKISISYTLSFELDKTSKSSELKELRVKMIHFFQNKSYLESVQEYSIGIKCVSIKFQQLYKPKRPKYTEDKLVKIYGSEIHIEKSFSIDLLLLDFETFLNSTKEEGYQMIGSKLMMYLEQLKYPQKIKDFNKELFNQDMREFFRGEGIEV